TANEATTHFVSPGNKFDGLFQAVWNWTISDKLLLELGETAKPDSWAFEPQLENSALTHYAVFDSGTGITSGASAAMTATNSRVFNGQAVVTYVPGSHNLKVGAQWYHGTRTNTLQASRDIRLNLTNGTPVSVTQFTTPLIATENLNLNLGIFA